MGLGVWGTGAGSKLFTRSLLRVGFVWCKLLPPRMDGGTLLTRQVSCRVRCGSAAPATKLWRDGGVPDSRVRCGESGSRVHAAAVKTPRTFLLFGNGYKARRCLGRQKGMGLDPVLSFVVDILPGSSKYFSLLIWV